VVMRHGACKGDDGYSGIREYLEVASVSFANASLVAELFALTGSLRIFTTRSFLPL
jgi:hypothetical protein